MTRCPHQAIFSINNTCAPVSINTPSLLHFVLEDSVQNFVGVNCDQVHTRNLHGFNLLACFIFNAALVYNSSSSLSEFDFNPSPAD
jgi:hypothetical protein